MCVHNCTYVDTYMYYHVFIPSKTGSFVYLEGFRLEKGTINCEQGETIFLHPLLIQHIRSQTFDAVMV